MIKQWGSMTRRVRHCLNLLYERITIALIIILTHSKLPQSLPRHLQPGRHRRSLARHQRPSLLPPVLVCEKTYVLDAEGLGPGVRRVLALVPEGAEGECEYTGLGDSVRDCDASRRGSGSGGVVFGAEEDRAGRKGETEGWNGYGKGGGEEGVVMASAQGSVMAIFAIIYHGFKTSIKRYPRLCFSTF